METHGNCIVSGEVYFSSPLCLEKPLSNLHLLGRLCHSNKRNFFNYSILYRNRYCKTTL